MSFMCCRVSLFCPSSQPVALACLRDNPTAVPGLGVTAGPWWCPPLLAGVWRVSPSPPRANPRAAAPSGRRRSAKINTWPSTARVSVSRAVGSIPSPGHLSCLWAGLGLSSMGVNQRAQPCQQWNLRIPRSCHFFRVPSPVFIPLLWSQLCPRVHEAGSAQSSCALPLVTIPFTPSPVRSGSPASNPTGCC